MKLRHILLAAAAALVCATSLAVPARPGAFKYTQPDGSVILLERHGDEFYSWTTLAGTSQVVEMGEDGFWHKTTLDPTARASAIKARRRVNGARRGAGLRGTQNDDPMTHGQRHIPVFLVNFSDLSFKVSDPNTAFYNLLNQQGYSTNGATGSVRDYYQDNSHGEFDPIFDVYGPVTLPQKMSYYGQNQGGQDSGYAAYAVRDAAQILDPDVDFSQYDADNDGYIDMVLMYYAGYNEAEGASASTIWPHQWDLTQMGINAQVDGKTLGAYFCTSELKGTSGVNMCGIGTTCHEFGHSLGLPDFYDTDYTDNGECDGLYWFSTMCSGSYNNDGRTPPYFNSEERILLGWMSENDVSALPEGSSSIGPVQNDIAFRTYTDTEGEYFLYECIDGTGWNQPLPTGMLVYHVDKSTTRSVGGLSPYEHWVNWEQYNDINAYGNHPCFYVVPAGDPTSLSYNGQYSNDWMFPGSKNVTSFIPIDWDGNDTGATVSGISYSGGIVTLNTTYSNERSITGKVTGQDGTPVSGVHVILSEPAASAPRMISLRSPRPRTYEAVTDSEGAFSISLDGYESPSAHLTFTKEGYQTKGVDVTLSPRTTSVTVVLLKEGETEMKEFSYWDPEASIYLGGYTGYGNSQMASIRIPASELPDGGGSVTSITFYPYYAADAYYVIIDAGSERVFTAEIDGVSQGRDGLVKVDLTDADFPAGKDLYIGYAVQNASTDYSGYPFIVGVGSHHTWYSRFNLEKSTWDQQEDEGYDLVLTATVVGKTGDTPPEPPVDEWDFARMGFNAIADPGNGEYKAGESFPLELELVEGVTATAETWTFDGGDVTGAKSVSLTAGTHTLTARVSLSDGTKETLQLILNVQ